MAHVGMWWLMLECGGSGWNVVAHVGMWWLMLECGSSCWNVVARVGMWCLMLRWAGSFVAGCGGSWRDVVAQSCLRCADVPWDVAAGVEMFGCGGSV